VHQLLECCVVEMESTIGNCINLLECSIVAIGNGINNWKVPQLLQFNVIVIEKWHQQLEGASTCWDVA
jgi:hypothetical protein